METLNDPTVQTAVHLWALLTVWGFYFSIALGVIFVIVRVIAGIADADQRSRTRASYAKSQEQGKALRAAYETEQADRARRSRIYQGLGTQAERDAHNAAFHAREAAKAIPVVEPIYFLG